MDLQEAAAKLKHALGRMRAVVSASLVVRPRSLAPARRRYREFGLRKPRFATVRHEEVAGLGEGTPTLDLPGGIELLRSDDRFAALAPSLRKGLEAWPERGYLVAEGFFDRDRARELGDEVERLAAAGTIRRHPRDPRFMNVHRKSAIGSELATDPRLLELIELVLGRPARLFQTIYFRNGSQQEAHSDAFHMMTEPPGFLVGVWIALEDIDEGSGPVFYLPGSHRLSYLMTEDLDVSDPPPGVIADKGSAYVDRVRAEVREFGAAEIPFTAKAGDVLLWHHNLIHGGSAVTREGATRRSLVGHYFAERVLCYHEVTERPALMPAGFD
jgi:ectoine hydroxylase-related dioxygenase (phytanoyl-CoA dioxygenase family)